MCDMWNTPGLRFRVTGISNLCICIAVGIGLKLRIFGDDFVRCLMCDCAFKQLPLLPYFVFLTASLYVNHSICKQAFLRHFDWFSVGFLPFFCSCISNVVEKSNSNFDSVYICEHATGFHIVVWRLCVTCLSSWVDNNYERVNGGDDLEIGVPHVTFE